MPEAKLTIVHDAGHLPHLDQSKAVVTIVR